MSSQCELMPQLKNRFRWFDFPPFPGKKTNGLFKSTLNVRNITYITVVSLSHCRRISRLRTAC